VLDAHFVIVGAVIGSAGAVAYIRDTVRGITKPNRVSWFLWALSPLLAFAVEINDGVGLRSLMTFVVGFSPLLIFLASFANPRSVWRISRLDVACGALSVAGLVAWLVTRHGLLALIAAVLSDALAGVPTWRKAWRYPETETTALYVASAVNALITLLTIDRVTTATLAFPLYIFVLATILSVVIGARLGPRFAATRRGAAVTPP
jgi:hypothetical protein